MNDCPDCGRCGSTDVVKHGSLNHQQAYKCKNCGHKFTRASRYNGLAGTSLIRTRKVD